MKNVDVFMEHHKNADYVVVADTGSTDGTQARLRELGAIVYDVQVIPWRFDLARNIALSLVPADVDICLSIDIDEQLQPGWKEALEAEWIAREGKINRISYPYVWSWKADGSPDMLFYLDKIHHRKNYRWRHPCHETVYFESPEPEHFIRMQNLFVHHHPDPTKSRSQYFNLLEDAVREDEHNDRMRYYYARELLYHGRYQEAIIEFEKHLNLPRATWSDERAMSCMHISKCYEHLGNNQESMVWAKKSTAEKSDARETWLEVARAGYRLHDWHTCFWAASKCLNISEKTTSHLMNPACWGLEPYDLASMASWWIGWHDKAREYGKHAYRMSPYDERLKGNCLVMGVPESELIIQLETVDNITDSDKEWIVSQINKTMKNRDAVNLASFIISKCGLKHHEDAVKNWDNLISMWATMINSDKDDPIMDVGATVGSAYLPSLAKFGYTNLTSINLTQEQTINADGINYQYGDCTKTDFEDDYFSFISCLSVIEHGVNVEDFLKESSRILRPNGHLFISTDYWQDPIDTRNQTAFGAPVKVFTSIEILELVEEAKKYNLELTSEVELTCEQRVVNWIGMDYTFINLLFCKKG
jgi:2-polyprenyl-3-methyl-5-hydroxy-6-metoxy-1,4-benzoquinol methylase/glycosyltransferase involved in cell wall biosynthesis